MSLLSTISLDLKPPIAEQLSMTRQDPAQLNQHSSEPPAPGLFRGILVLGLLLIIFWGIVRVMPRYIACALNGQFEGYFHCRHDVRFTNQQGMSGSVQERDYLLRP